MTLQGKLHLEHIKIINPSFTILDDIINNDSDNENNEESKWKNIK